MRDRNIVGVELLRRIKHRDDKVCIGERAHRALDADHLYLIDTMANSRGVLDYHRIWTDLDRFLDHVARGSRNRGHDGAIGTEDQIQDARLADVGLADDSDPCALSSQPTSRIAVVQNGNVTREVLDRRCDLASRWQRDTFIGKIYLRFKVCADRNQLAPKASQLVRQTHQ